MFYNYVRHFGSLPEVYLLFIASWLYIKK